MEISALIVKFYFKISQDSLDFIIIIINLKRASVDGPYSRFDY